MPELQTIRNPPAGLAHVETWIFDLDNTLYPARCRLFEQVSRRIAAYIAERFQVDLEAARAMQKRFFREHGTTMRGLMTLHNIEPGEFLTYVHDIDISAVEPSAALEAALARLPGRKIVFTNGSVAHAERVMARLGIGHHFIDIFDIVAANYQPKPDPLPYRQLCDRHGFDPRSAAMVEDMARNLLPAHALGMTTVWVPGFAEWSSEGGTEHIHHVVEDLIEWLERLTAPAD